MAAASGTEMLALFRLSVTKPWFKVLFAGQ